MLIIAVSNISDLAPVSDYNVEVAVVGWAGWDGRKTLWQGIVTGHTRTDGWIKLLRMIVKRLPKTGG